LSVRQPRASSVLFLPYIGGLELGRYCFSPFVLGLSPYPQRCRPFLSPLDELASFWPPLAGDGLVFSLTASISNRSFRYRIRRASHESTGFFFFFPDEISPSSFLFSPNHFRSFGKINRTLGQVYCPGSLVSRLVHAPGESVDPSHIQIFFLSVDLFRFIRRMSPPLSLLRLHPSSLAQCFASLSLSPDHCLKRAMFFLEPFLLYVASLSCRVAFLPCPPPCMKRFSLSSPGLRLPPSLPSYMACYRAAIRPPFRLCSIDSIPRTPFFSKLGGVSDGLALTSPVLLLTPSPDYFRSFFRPRSLLPYRTFAPPQERAWALFFFVCFFFFSFFFFFLFFSSISRLLDLCRSFFPFLLTMSATSS